MKFSKVPGSVRVYFSSLDSQNLNQASNSPKSEPYTADSSKSNKSYVKFNPRVCQVITQFP